MQGLFRKAREKIGFVPNVFRAYSFRPERLVQPLKQLHEPAPDLDAAEQEMIAVAVSMANCCLYCLVAFFGPSGPGGTRKAGVLRGPDPFPLVVRANRFVSGMRKYFREGSGHLPVGEKDNR
jgi:hypothetical protein